MATQVVETPILTLDRAPAVDSRTWKASRFDRVGITSGIVAALLFLAGTVVFITTIVPDLPAIHAPAAERAAFYARMARSTVYRGLSYLGELQMMLLLPFFGALAGRLRSAEGGNGALASTVLAAGVVLAVVTPLVILLEDHLMLGFATAGGIDPVIVARIDGMGPLSFALGGFPQVLVAWGTVGALRAERAIPRWLGWFGIAVGVLSLVGTLTLMRGALFPIASLAMVLFRVWLLALGVVLLRRARQR